MQAETPSLLQGSWQAWQGTVFTNAKAGMQSVDAAKVKQVCSTSRRRVTQSIKRVTLRALASALKNSSAHRLTWTAKPRHKSILLPRLVYWKEHKLHR